MKIPNKILITITMMVVSFGIFLTNVEAASTGPSSCSVSPASVSMGQNESYDLSVSIDRASVGTDSVYVSAMEFQAGAYSDLSTVIPANANSANVKIYTTETAKAGNGTFKVYCSTGCSKASCPGGGSPDVIGSATVALNISGADAGGNPSGEGDAGFGSSSCKIPSVSIPSNSSLLIPIYTKRLSSGTLSLSGVSGPNISITPVFPSIKFGPYGSLGREKMAAVIKTGPSFSGGSYSITCDLPDGKHTATASAILPFVANSSGKIKLSQVEYLNDTMFPKSDCPFAVPGCNAFFYGNGPKVLTSVNGVALVGGNVLFTKGNPGNGNRDTARYFSLTDPMNPMRVDSMTGPAIDSSLDAAGDYGSTYSIKSVAYSKDGKYSAVVSSQRQLFVSVNGGKKVMVGSNIIGDVSIVKSGSDYIFLSDQGAINITNPVDGREGDQASLPSNFPILDRGSKVVLGDDSYVAVIPDDSRSVTPKTIKLFSVNEKESITELAIPTESLENGNYSVSPLGKVSFSGGDYIYAIHSGSSSRPSVTKQGILDVFKLEYASKKITQVVKGALLPIGVINSIAGFDVGGGNLGILVFGADSNSNGKIRAFLFSDLIAGKVSDVLTNSSISIKYFDPESSYVRDEIVGPSEFGASSYSKDGITYVYTTDTWGLDVKVWKFEANVPSVSGGGGYSAPAPTPTPVELTDCPGGTIYDTSAGKLCVNSSGGVTTTTSYNFGKPIPPKIEKSPSSSKYDFGASVLKEGSAGEAVKELQRFLNAELGLGLEVDGKLGPKTIAVIKQWQSDHGLVSDGLVGSKTKALMNASSN